MIPLFVKVVTPIIERPSPPLVVMREPLFTKVLDVLLTVNSFENDTPALIVSAPVLQVTPVASQLVA
jgi:hypothetical protein